MLFIAVILSLFEYSFPTREEDNIVVCMYILFIIESNKEIDGCIGFIRVTGVFQGIMIRCTMLTKLGDGAPKSSKTVSRLFLAINQSGGTW